MKLSQLFLSLSALVPAALAANNWIVSGVPWYDNNGKVIQAHGGGIRKEGNTFWWVGEDKTGNTGSFQNGFHLYSSTDLANWTDEGIILKASSDTNSPIGPDKVGERPKIIYNEQTQTYVLWFHSEDSGYALANVGVATAPDIKGPYTFKASWRPLGTESRDMSVYVDDDQKGYLVWATNNNAELTCAQLTDDTPMSQEAVSGPSTLDGKEAVSPNVTTSTTSSCLTRVAGLPMPTSSFSRIVSKDLGPDPLTLHLPTAIHTLAR